MQHLIGVGPVTALPREMKPSKSSLTKELFVYNMRKKIIESSTLLLNDVRDISVSGNGHAVLISYENETIPPQLWTLRRDTVTNLDMELSHKHTYRPRVSGGFTGPAYFVGEDDDLIMCASRVGAVNIWHSHSAQLLHTLRVKAPSMQLMCMAPSTAAEGSLMLALGYHTGNVQIWSKPPAPDTMSNRISIVRRRANSIG